MARTRRASAGLMSASMSRWRFRLVLFEVRMCLLKARLRFTFPLEERRNRLAAPFFVYIFGIGFPYRFGGAAAGLEAAACGGADPLHFLGARIMSRNGPSCRGSDSTRPYSPTSDRIRARIL